TTVLAKPKRPVYVMLPSNGAFTLAPANATGSAPAAAGTTDAAPRASAAHITAIPLARLMAARYGRPRTLTSDCPQYASALSRSGAAATGRADPGAAPPRFVRIRRTAVRPPDLTPWSAQVCRT